MRAFMIARMSIMWVGITCVSWLGSIPAMADEVPMVWFVQADALGSNGGLTWQDAYADLQDALAVAVAGDQIWVASGTYTPGGPGDRTASFELKSGVEIYGGFVGTEVSINERDPVMNLTILSGDLNSNDIEILEPPELANEPTRSDNSYHVVTGSGTDETAVLDGFVITGGNANASGNTNGGGMINIGSTNGLVQANPTLVNCTFHGNSASRKGGGVYSSGGSPTFVNCTFRGNHALGSRNIPDGGGGMYNLNASPTVKDCTFRRNTTGGRGAGMYNSGSSQTIIRCLFEENETFLSPSDDTRVGGGILSLYSNTVIRECVFAENIAGNGGGVFCGDGTSATIVHSLFFDNHAVQLHTDYNRKGDGGALQNYGADLTVIHCTFTGNTAIKPAAAGMSSQNGGSSTVNNCIFWGNVASEGTGSAAQIGGTDPVHVTHSCVQGGFPGMDNIETDPLFADPENGDYRLKSQAGRWNPLSENWIQDDVTSPCIDAGDPVSPIGLEPFPSGGFVNMGAYGATATASKTYFGKPVPQTIVAGDINGDGEVDLLDLEIMALHWTGNQPLELP
jgi:predicted outer membrane repeat protein